MKFIVAKLLVDSQEDGDADGEADDESTDIDGAVQLVFGELAPGDLEIVLQHVVEVCGVFGAKTMPDRLGAGCQVISLSGLRAMSGSGQCCIISAQSL